MHPMSAIPMQHLLQHAEPLAAISIAYLRPATRQRLADDELSVLAYPNDYGGFVYVGPAGENAPSEPELIPLFTAARAGGIVWLKFDADAETVEGFATFPDQEMPS
ncbi:conserved hypothetical protein [Acidovorax delafieldii 2AN]|uniref:DUF5983 domain-containing protein n=1 Tax=Acidovorax delafieldii 2AN TaxID=573060 RepID=C5T036_ACIDE|nr:hypothetical protein [Acidovorax delafieldii]EER62144.1 conserved hypothetical protein [Acidovorax delafieldii 2AN]